MGRLVRLLAAGGMGGILCRERRAIQGALRASVKIRPGVFEVRREGSVPALYGKVGAILEPRSRFLVHLDGVFWVGEETGAASVSLGAGYRFSVSLR